MKAIIIMNTQHSLMDCQKNILDKHYDSYDIFPVPVQGWTFDQMDDKIKQLQDIALKAKTKVVIIFASPIPYMMMKLQGDAFYTDRCRDGIRIIRYGVGAFQAPLRKKVQKGDNIFYTVPQDGWKIVGLSVADNGSFATLN